ncbi:MFS transporter [Streptomyces subrutilus]|uniref:MFS transporter n=1 Tax=Streptomyces subrutilus TaxID=36818 RepID=A0A5P2UHR3_9ACTN|nr:MFS transporter [Streptomyces subrutilus]QEU78783.1 MFS transporter [Streptomyces subrutilus]WSJ32032.1 MFS transporter [Streptomyces subrutilus]GGZ57721.1 MFS transporter [Streptomyces subrutilus]
MRRVLLLGAGAFAVGTDTYVMAGLLPEISADLHGSTALTGQLVTVFTLAYALVAPPAGAALSRRGVRAVLLGALALFTAANAVSALAPGTAVLMAARGAAGVAAGVFMPMAATAASALAGPERRGRALAVVLGGLSSGTVLGVPVGVLLADRAGWRAALWLVTGLGAAALAGLALFLPAVEGSPMQSLRSRFAQALSRSVGSVVLTTFLQATASLGLYTYLVAVLADTGAAGAGPGLWLWGLGGVLGSFGIGQVLDRLGRPGALVGVLLALLALALAALPAAAGPAGPVLLVLWGAAGWAFVVPQQHRLLGISTAAGPAALALNSSATYLGGAAGAGLGGAALAAGAAPHTLPLGAAACAGLALAVHLTTGRTARRTADGSGAAGATKGTPCEDRRERTQLR